MKKDIQPTYYPKAKIVCSCGAQFTIGSTIKEMKVEICSQCHPFYTGKQKLIDTARRIDRYQKIIDKKKALDQEKMKRKLKSIKPKSSPAKKNKPSSKNSKEKKIKNS